MAIPMFESDPRSRPQPHAFFPPKLSRGVTWTCKRTAPLNIRRKLKVTDIDIRDEDLESQLFEDAPDASLPSYDRLRRIGAAVLAANEQRHGIKPDPDADMDDRIQRMKETIVREIEQQLDIVPRADALLLDRIRGCFNAVDRIVSDDDKATPYQQKLADEQSRAAVVLYDDLWRVLQFVAIYEGYVRESLTVERVMDVLCLLEMEVFNERRIWGPRKAVIRVGELVSLRDRFDAYKSDKRGTVRKTSLALESSVREMLNDLSAKHSTPVAPS
jgi:hypothetical protein